MNKSDLNSPPTPQNEVIMVLFHGSSFYKQTVMRQKKCNYSFNCAYIAPNLDSLSFRVCLKESHKQKKFSCVLLCLLEILRSVYKLPQMVPPEKQ